MPFAYAMIHVTYYAATLLTFFHHLIRCWRAAIAAAGLIDI